MSHNFEISNLGFRLIKAYEGYRPAPVQLVTGQTVVGHGHIVGDEKITYVSKEQAERLLRHDLRPIERMVNDAVHAPLSQAQFDALCSLAFNIGETAFRDSHVRHAINNGRILDAANGFDAWRKADIDGKTYVVDALMRRRTAEKALFLKAESAAVSAGREEIKPQRDDTVSDVSDDASKFDPEEGIVAHAPHVRQTVETRRVERAPLNLSEPAREPEPEPEPELDSGAGDSDEDNISQAMARLLPETLSPNTVSPDPELADEIDFPPEEEPDLIQQIAPVEPSFVDADTQDGLEPEFKTIEPLRAVPERFKPAIVSRGVASPANHPETDGEEPDEISPFIDDSEILGAPDDDMEQPDYRTFAAEKKTPKSPIALAAEEVGDRLDRLIDDTRNPDADEPSNIDESLTLEEARAHQKAPIVNSADRYVSLPDKNTNAAARESSYIGVYIAFIVFGAALFGGGIAAHMLGGLGNTGWISFIIPTAIVLGATVMLGSAYYLIRSYMRRQD